MTGLTTGDCPPGSCSGWLLAPDLAPCPINQGLVLFHPAGNATDVSTAPIASPFTGGVCTDGLGCQDWRSLLIFTSHSPQQVTQQHGKYLWQLSSAVIIRFLDSASTIPFLHTQNV